jgi:hypothetical protein
LYWPTCGPLELSSGFKNVLIDEGEVTIWFLQWGETKGGGARAVVEGKKNSKNYHLLHLQNKKFSYFPYYCHHLHIINSIIVTNTILITITTVVIIAITIFNLIIFINCPIKIFSLVFVRGLIHTTCRQRMFQLYLMQLHVGH